MTIQQLIEKEDLTPSEMKRLGKRVTYFMSGSYADPRSAFRLARDHVDILGGQVYTGLHADNGDWARLRWWSKGWHIVNRTMDYAVVNSEHSKS